MQALSTFFKTLFKALTQPRYYADVIKARTSFAVKYFVFLNMIFEGILAVIFSFIIAAIPIQTIANKVVAALPQDFELQVQNGKVSINQPLPYGIEMPAELNSMPENVTLEMSGDRVQLNNTVQSDSRTKTVSQKSQPKYAVIFVSDDDIQSIDDALKYDTMVLVTETKIFAHQSSDGSELRVYPISPDVENFSISTAKVQDGVTRFFSNPIMSYKLYTIPIGLVMFFFLFWFGFFFRLMVLVMYAIIVWVIAKIFKGSILHNKSITFGDLLKVSMLTFTWPMILGNLTSFATFLNFKVAGFWHFLVFAVWTIVCLHQATAAMGSSSSVSAVTTPVPSKTSKVTTSTKKSSRKK